MTGGDQNRILDSIAAFPRIDLAAKIRARFQAGIPFAGTSAGTAIVSSIALRGDTGTRPGLDLLPTSIVDQHFITRGREPRLKSALALHPGLIGVGVEEGSAVAIRGGERFETFGPAPLTIIRDGMTELLLAGRKSNVAGFVSTFSPRSAPGYRRRSNQALLESHLDHGYFQRARLTNLTS